jgi:hypothetical protein
MTDIKAIFNAGRVSRWHMHPDLSLSGDTLDGHQGRVARIMLRYWPDTPALVLAYALTHDDGEAVTGDLRNKSTAQQDTEDDARSCLWGGALPEACEFTLRWWLRFKLADMLDAYMWMMHKAPHLQSHPDWQEHWRDLQCEASDLGVTINFD